MYKLRHLLLIIYYAFTKAYISFMFLNKQVFVINGLRRSGNHLFINWFASALENQLVNFEGNKVSYSCNTILFNEVNSGGVFNFIQNVSTNKDRIKKSKYVIISLEDYIPRKRIDPYIPVSSYKISIVRTILNVISSRITYAIRKAYNGQGRGDMTISDKFFEIYQWLTSSAQFGWVIWLYDSWNEDEKYRKEFLGKYNLSFNINPGISKQGDGSSYSGQEIIPDSKQVRERYKSFDFPDRVVGLLNKYRESLILDRSEIEFIHQLNVNLTSTTNDK